MSWNAYLNEKPCEHCKREGASHGEWNYTHNCNGMANLALDSKYKQREVFEEVFHFKDREHVSWWKLLDGKSGIEGAAILADIITAMEGEPDKYRALNPDNGWGDFNSFLGVLKAMRAAVPTDVPTQWDVSG